MPISTNMIVRVAHAHVAMHMAFSRTVAYWQSSAEQLRPWKVLQDGCDAVLIGKDDGLVIDGACSNRVSAPDGGVLHIHGDLNSNIDAGGHHEIIVTGDILPDARIKTAGFCDLFVGGKFSGQLSSIDSAKVWIGGDFNGILQTGHPSTEIHVDGNFNGELRPTEVASLLWLTVGGFASQASLTRIMECGYTQFHASVTRSDIAPGIYPTNCRRRKTTSGNSFNSWCVRSQART